jgi:hypothetical protein
MLDPLLEQGVAGLEGPRHERGEAAERVLELADRVEVVEQIVCPAAQSRSSTSTTVRRLTSATVRISEAVKKCGVTCGKRRRVSLTRVV